MSSPFTDPIDTPLASGDDTYVDAETGVRFEDDDHPTVGEGVYESDDGERSVADVDGRKLHETPTIAKLRYHYRQTPFGGTVVNKPVDDAFKYGYTIHNDPTDSVAPFLDEYVPIYKQARKKARRDGFAVIYYQLRDAAEQYESPRDVAGINRMRVLTLDHFTQSNGTVPRTAIENTPFDGNQLDVTDSGLVVVDDLTHPRDEELLGYVIDAEDRVPVGEGVSTRRFLHVDRCQHITVNEAVDGNPNKRTFGQHEGESVLTAALHPLEALDKGDWAMGEALFRYSAPIYGVETPSDYGESEFNEARDALHNLSAASEMVFPPGTEFEVYDGASDFDPETFYDVLIEEVAAATEFTKSVLLGTQTGTVSGSETDVKNYFNAVEEKRHNAYENDIDEALRMVSSWDLTVVPTFALGYQIEWEPLFQVDEVERVNGLARVVDAAAGAINSYVMTPSEAREFVEHEFAEFEADVDLDALSEADMDRLDRVNLRQNGSAQGAAEDEPDIGGDVRRGNENAAGEGGMEQGQQTAASDPT